MILSSLKMHHVSYFIFKFVKIDKLEFGLDMHIFLQDLLHQRDCYFKYPQVTKK